MINNNSHMAFPNQIQYILNNYDIETTDKFIVQLLNGGFQLLKIRLRHAINSNKHKHNNLSQNQQYISKHIQKYQCINMNNFTQILKTKYEFLNMKVLKSSSQVTITINNLRTEPCLKRDSKKQQQKIMSQLLLYSIYFQNVNFQLVNLDSSSLVVNSNSIEQKQYNKSCFNKNIEKYRLCSLLFKVNILDLIHCMFKIDTIKLQLILSRSLSSNNVNYVIGFTNGMKSNNKTLQHILNLIYLDQYILNGDKSKYKIYFNIISKNNEIIEKDLFNKLSNNIQKNFRKRQSIKVFNLNKKDFINIPNQIFGKVYSKLNEVNKSLEITNFNKQLKFELEDEIDNQYLFSFSSINFNCVLQFYNFSQQVFNETKYFFSDSQLVCSLQFDKLLVINHNIMYLINCKYFLRYILIQYLKGTKILNYATFTKPIFVQQVLAQLMKSTSLKFNIKKYSKIIVDFRSIIMQHTKIVIQATGQIKCIPYPHQELRDVNLLKFAFLLAKIAYYINNNKKVIEKVFHTYLIEYFTQLKYQKTVKINQKPNFITTIWNYLKQGIKVPNQFQFEWKQPLQDMKYLLKQFGRC